MKNKKQLADCDLVKETIKFYEEDPDRRAIDNTGECVYVTSDNKHCAIGRKIDWNKVKELGYTKKQINSSGSLSRLNTFLMMNNKVLEDILQDNCKNISAKCWENLQDFHDFSFLWEKDSTKERKKRISLLKTRFCSSK